MSGIISPVLQARLDKNAKMGVLSKVAWITNSFLSTFSGAVFYSVACSLTCLKQYKLSAMEHINIGDFGLESLVLLQLC